jgi:hypothetical protein
MLQDIPSFHEPFRTTLLRNAIIAIVGGLILSRFLGGLNAILVMLWPSFGGHYLDVWFLNWLRPRLPLARTVQIAARLGVWFFGGIALALGMCLTASVRAPWWLGGFAFIGIELIAHVPMQLRGQPSFYNGRG